MLKKVELWSMIKLDYILWGIYTMVREAFANMKVKKVIVHQVYARDYENNPKEPFYSSECIPRNKVDRKSVV